MPARISDVGHTVYVAQQSRLELGCKVVGDPLPSKKWFLNGRDEAWLNRRNSVTNQVAYIDGESDSYGSRYRADSLVIKSATPENANGNYTCYAENKLGSDSVTYDVHVQGKEAEKERGKNFG